MKRIANALFGVARDIVWLGQTLWYSWQRR
ncbi:hypothetical protein SAMN05444921_101172 [Streptomyces wuyuanensis]|jgi:hypothetical protein|uniref:Uncharacterized protein n=1 Tax=Streptomyces wuyuanensis TaxID=1196353 RepID=A0A1G9MMA8_9ACTN|nr:hypothetical protein SAMN05444921_101172 [Streptomyces wuyuanensis]